MHRWNRYTYTRAATCRLQTVNELMPAAVRAHTQRHNQTHTYRETSVSSRYLQEICFAEVEFGSALPPLRVTLKLMSSSPPLLLSLPPSSTFALLLLALPLPQSCPLPRSVSPVHSPPFSSPLQVFAVFSFSSAPAWTPSLFTCTDGFGGSSES